MRYILLLLVMVVLLTPKCEFTFGLFECRRDIGGAVVARRIEKQARRFVPRCCVIFCTAVCGCFDNIGCNIGVLVCTRNIVHAHVGGGNAAAWHIPLFGAFCQMFTQAQHIRFSSRIVGIIGKSETCCTTWRKRDLLGCCIWTLHSATKGLWSMHLFHNWIRGYWRIPS